MKVQFFSEHLRRLIKEKHLTISQVAKLANISRQGLYKILNGDTRQIKLTTFIMLARVLNEHPLSLLNVFFYQSEFPPINIRKNTAIHDQFSLANDVGFLADVTYPINSFVRVGEYFQKTWELQNIGDMPWKGRRLLCVDDKIYVCSKNGEIIISHGLTPNYTSLEIPVVNPNEHYTLSVIFKAPSYPCSVASHWKMLDKNGNYCFLPDKFLTCLVKVMTL